MAPTTPHAGAGRFQGEPAVVLRAGEVTAMFVPGVGMTGVSLRYRGREHLALPGGLAAVRAGSTGGLPLLAPWANRLGSLRYRAAGVDVDLAGLPLHTDGHGLPIHGFLVGAPGWQVKACSASRGRARLLASLDVDAPAFPFPHRIEVSAEAGARGLTVTTRLVPTGARAVPVAFGWHPYLRLPGSPRRRWRLRLPSRTHLTLDERSLPDGGAVPEGREAEPIGDRTFDDLYLLGRERRLALLGEDASLALNVGTGYRCAQVWVPGGGPHAALEPMTGPINSLGEGTAPLVAPGDAYQADFTLEPGDGEG